MIKLDHYQISIVSPYTDKVHRIAITEGTTVKEVVDYLLEQVSPKVTLLVRETGDLLQREQFLDMLCQTEFELIRTH